MQSHSTSDMSNVVRYIHCNSLYLKIVKNLYDWAYSSYWNYVDLRNGNLPSKAEILYRFKDRADFRNFSGRDEDDPNIEKYVIE